ncbi:MAG: TonB-dependent receptor [Sphingobium sp.]
MTSLVAISWSGSAMAQSEDASREPISRQDASDIIVTARQRAESVQNIPVAVSAYSEKQLETYGMSGLEKIADSTPNLIIARGSSGGGVDIRIRGIGSSFSSVGIEQSVAVVVDGAFYAKGRIINEAFVDVGQVEVMKGPQALFFGKNATAGVISISTKDPGPDLEIQARTGYEFRAHTINGDLVVSGPLSETLGARLSVSGSSMDRGYIRNIAGEGPYTAFDVATGTSTTFVNPAPDKWSPRSKNITGRLTLKYTPTDELTVRLKTSYSRDRDNGSTWNSILAYCPVNNHSQFDPSFECGRRRVNAQRGLPPEIAKEIPWGDRHGGQNYNDYDAFQSTLGIDYDTSTLSVRSISNYQWSRNLRLGDYDFTPADGVPSTEKVKWRALSQEVRVLTKFDGPLNVMVGGLFQDTKLDYTNYIAFFALRDTSAPAGFESAGLDKLSYTDGRTWSGFGQAIWTVTPQIELTGGVRYTHETKQSQFVHSIVNPGVAAIAVGNVPIVADQKFTNWSPEFAATWKPSPDLTIYAAYKQNFKSGGFSNGTLYTPTTLPGDLSFAPEKVKGVEGGIKGKTLDGNLRFDLTLFSYKYRNLQIDFFDAARTAYETTNIGSSRTRGAELALNWTPPVEGLQFNANLNYNDAKYLNFIGPCYTGQTIAQGCNITLPNGRLRQDLSGAKLPLAPKWSGSLGVDYQVDLGAAIMTLATQARYSGAYLVSGFGSDLKQNKYVNLDATIGFRTPDDKWQFALIGRNLTNRFVMTSNFEGPLTGTAAGQTSGILSDQVVSIANPRTVQAQITWRY